MAFASESALPGDIANRQVGLPEQGADTLQFDAPYFLHKLRSAKAWTVELPTRTDLTLSRTLYAHIALVPCAAHGPGTGPGLLE
jgi:hypothetical protein